MFASAQTQMHDAFKIEFSSMEDGQCLRRHGLAPVDTGDLDLSTYTFSKGTSMKDSNGLHVSNGPASGMASALVDSAAHSTDQVIRSSQRALNDKLDQLAERLEDMRERTGPALDRLGAGAQALTDRSLDAVRGGSQQLRERALHASDATVARIRNEPIKSVLVAAAGGAALMALVSLLSRSSRTRS